ncbi:uncharacterized protein LOC112059902 isoform X2 [Chrysemys picta bellii]|uniref:uncharacterized protein LOC112059902 isoform X2 n=1 Tax=Chrysemys picta bellii TaxID=8478 RepID=UPI0032B25909
MLGRWGPCSPLGSGSLAQAPPPAPLATGSPWLRTKQEASSGREPDFRSHTSPLPSTRAHPAPSSPPFRSPPPPSPRHPPPPGTAWSSCCREFRDPRAEENEILLLIWDVSDRNSFLYPGCSGKTAIEDKECRRQWGKTLERAALRQEISKHCMKMNTQWKTPFC